MDDIDDFFGDDACDAFVSGIKFEAPSQSDDADSKKEMIKSLLENEELLIQSLLGQNAEEETKKGKFSGLSETKTVEILKESEPAGHLYSKDTAFLSMFIKDNRRKDSYQRSDLLDIARMLIKQSA